MSNTRVLKTYSHNQIQYRLSKNCEILQFLSLNLLFFKFQKLQIFKVLQFWSMHTGT